MKSVFMFNSPKIALNHSQADNPMAQAPFPCAEHYFGGLFNPYGPHLLVGSQITGMTSTRIPLPLDLADDNPIYVNAKQYHGILRRRRSRAKLETQKKLIKSRKPYLHESRHLHALNRTRGSGGRFLSTKKLQQLDPISTSIRKDALSTIHSLQKNNDTKELGSFHSNSNCSDISSISDGDAIFRQPDHSAMPSCLSEGMQLSGSLMYRGT